VASGPARAGSIGRWTPPPRRSTCRGGSRRTRRCRPLQRCSAGTAAGQRGPHLGKNNRCCIRSTRSSPSSSETCLRHTRNTPPHRYWSTCRSGKRQSPMIGPCPRKKSLRHTRNTPPHRYWSTCRSGNRQSPMIGPCPRKKSLQHSRRRRGCLSSLETAPRCIRSTLNSPSRPRSDRRCTHHTTLTRRPQKTSLLCSSCTPPLPPRQPRI